MNFLRKLAFTAAALAFSTFVAANEIEVTIDGDNSSADVVFVDCFFLFCDIDATTVGGLDGLSTMLDEGESWHIPFFDLTVGAFGVGSAIIEAALAFASPEFAVVGAGGGIFSSLTGILSSGFLIWEEIDPILLTDGTSLLVEFESFAFVGDEDTTNVWTKTVYASVTRMGAGGVVDPFGDGGSTSVPEPGTLALLGIGLLAAGVAQRRRRRTNH